MLQPAKEGFEKTVKENGWFLDGKLFNPYKYLYLTAPTKINYRFPLFNKSSTFSDLSANWGENIFSENSEILNKFFNGFKNIAARIW